MYNSYQTNQQYQTCSNCRCQDQVVLLQSKLTQVHGKLLQQIDICKQQESLIIDLEEKMRNFERNQYKHRESYQTFGGQHSPNKQNKIPNFREFEDSSEGYVIKNDLLQADLEAMRHRVLTEITDKNRLIEQMGDLKKRYRKQLANELKKFQGLEILYKKLQQQKGYNPTENTTKMRLDYEKLIKKLEQLQIKLQRQKQRNKLIQNQNKALQRQIINLKQLLSQKQPQQRKVKNLYTESSTDQLREIDNLKQQISRINRSITLRQNEFKQRHKNNDQQDSEDMISRQTKLVGWGKRQKN